MRSTDLRSWTSDGVEVLVDQANRLEARGMGPESVDREFLRFEVDLVP
jgi:hypothetical protein